MANPVTHDNVLEASTTTGTGTFTLTGPVAGYQPLSLAADGDLIPYSIWCVDGSGNRTAGGCETGVGTVGGSGTTLARTTVLESSNANALVNFGAGTKHVALAHLAQTTPQLGAANTWTVGPQTIQTGADGNKGLVVKANSPTQTANLEEWQSSSGGFWGAVGFNGHMAIGPDAAVDDVSLFYAGSIAKAFISCEQTYTDVPADLLNGVTSYIRVDPSVACSAYITGVDSEIEIPSGNSQNFTNTLFAGYYFVSHKGSGVASNLYGLVGTVIIDGGTATESTAIYARMDNDGSGIIGKAKGIWIQTFNAIGGTMAEAYGLFITDSSNSGTIGNNFGAWIGDQDASGITNSYGIWYDGPAVYHIKADGIMAYYNPSFTKYTPGATNYERVAQQWVADVLQYGPEAGGTGVVRPMRFIGSNILIGTSTANAAAIFQIDSTTQGALFPRLTTTQRDAVSSPPEGLLVFNTTTHALNQYNGSSWGALGTDVDNSMAVLAGQIFGA